MQDFPEKMNINKTRFTVKSNKLFNILLNERFLVVSGFPLIKIHKIQNNNWSKFIFFYSRKNEEFKKFDIVED